MIPALFALAAVMIVGGIASVVQGFPFVRLESGLAMVIAGATTASAGAIVLALAAVAARVRGLARVLTEAAADRGPAPAVPAWREEGPSPYATASSGLRVDPVPDAPTADGTETANRRPAIAGAALAGLAGGAGVAFARSHSEPSFEDHATDPDGAHHEEPFLPGLPQPIDEPAPHPSHDRAHEPTFAEPTSAEPTFVDPAYDARIFDEPVAPAPSLDPPASQLPPVEARPEAIVQPDARAPSEEVAEPMTLRPALAVEEATIAPPMVMASPEPAPMAQEVMALPEIAPAPTEEAPEPERQVVGTYASGGNTYVMFSTGVIEADTPRGRFTFDSLDELKAFVEAGGEMDARGAA